MYLTKILMYLILIICESAIFDNKETKYALSTKKESCLKETDHLIKQ